MAITNFSELQTAIGNWLDRTDAVTVARIPEFIALAEGKLRRDLRTWLRTDVELASVSDNVTLSPTPAVSEVLGVAYNDGPGGIHNHPLNLITRENYQRALARDSTARSPSDAVFVDRDEHTNVTALRFYPPPDGPIAGLRVEYVAELPSLSISQTSNRLLAVAPDVYLYASLAEAEVFLEHDERAGMWDARVQQGVRDLEAQVRRKLFAGSPRPVRLPYVF